MNMVPDRLTLDNCAQEPIHIPGRIQSHGVLFAFDRLGVLMHRSTNAVDGPRRPVSPRSHPVEFADPGSIASCKGERQDS